MSLPISERMFVNGPAQGFNFHCRRCESVLEARSDQCGVQGRCPTCGAEFTIPEIDVKTGLALTDADPGDDGQDPTPVHAYAAAGNNAPRLERAATGTLTIRCPRCNRASAVDSDACASCGLPFTLDGMRAVPSSPKPSCAAVSLAMGAVAFATIGYVPYLPSALAIGFGARALGRRARSPRAERRSLAVAGITCGVLAAVLRWVMFSPG